VAAFRWVALAWMAVVVVVLRHDLARPWLAVLLTALAAAVTVTLTILLRSDPSILLRPGPVLVELAVAVAVVAGDGWAYKAGHAFGSSQTLGVIWPLSAVLAVGVALGGWTGAAAGCVLGAARIADGAANGIRDFGGRRLLSVLSTTLVYALAGATLGYVTSLLREAREEVSEARARDQVARTLHDGVLQTLAVIQRRSTDPAIASLAHDQERELRDYLFESRPKRLAPGAADLAVGLRAAAARFERAFEASAEVLVADDVPALSAAQVEALTGAVGEALTNAGKHGRAARVTVFVEPGPSAGLFCSVRDDGTGFDPATVVEGVGLVGSIRARMTDVGGRVEIHSAPGEGAEVCLWLN
jgi:signal transduction histidine kinase